MEAQTLHEQIPVYHVCQECGGEGCIHCSDLCIVYGDIEFNVDECIRDIQLDPEWNDELPEPSPINGVIGIKALSGLCDFCGSFSESLDQLKSDSDSSVSIKICPSCYSDYVRGGCDHPERD